MSRAPIRAMTATRRSVSTPSLSERSPPEFGAALDFTPHGWADYSYLYRDELEAWAEDDIVELHPAFSAEPAGGIKYVQDRLWADRARVTELGKQGAMSCVYGDARTWLRPSTRPALGSKPRALE
jgi:hypothetical protein